MNRANVKVCHHYIDLPGRHYYRDDDRAEITILIVRLLKRDLPFVKGLFQLGGSAFVDRKEGIESAFFEFLICSARGGEHDVRT